MTYNNKVLRVNLSTKQISTEELNKKYVQDYIGGRGLGTRMLLDEVDPKVDPLSVDNKLLFVTGPATGVKVSTGTRYMVITKSPLNNFVTSSNSGGVWGSMLKYAGYDIVIVEGKAENPVYLEINESEVKLHDASDLWGKVSTEVEEHLKEKHVNASVLNIGPAGENLSNMAAIMNDGDRAAGRSGVGAVMGSKNLKAIVCSTEQKTMEVKDAKFKEYAIETAKKIKANPISGEGLPTYGTAVLVNILNSIAGLPTKNWQLSEFESAEMISGEELAENHLKKRSFCHNCTIGCGRVVEVDGKIVGGPEYETIWGFGASSEVADLAFINKANYLCNEMGLDTISTSSTIAAAMELYEKGLITDEMCGDTPLKFGNNDAIVTWVENIGRCNSELAKILAQGSYDACAHFGAPEYSMTAKKLEMPAYDARAIQGIGLNYATSNRGGCHVRGYTIASEVLAPPEAIVDRTTIDGKAGLVKVYQDLTAAIDSIGMCLFTSFALGADDYAGILSFLFEREISAEEVLLIGERIYSLERHFNQLTGMEENGDKLPERVLTEKVTARASEGMVSRLPEMLPEYYELRGWEKGFPTTETLTKLGII